MKLFYPYSYVDSVFQIDFNELYKNGYRGLVFDIDNTLVPHGDDSTKETDDLLINLLNIGFKLIILSNNTEERITRFLKNIDIPYIYDAQKPKKEGYLKAIQILNLDKDKILFIGDQIITDIFGANRIKAKSILVKYIGFGTEKKIGKRRRLENFILYFYKKSRYYDRLGNINKKEGQ